MNHAEPSASPGPYCGTQRPQEARFLGRAVALWTRFARLSKPEKQAILLSFCLLWLARIWLPIASFSRIRAWLSRLPPLGRARSSPDRLCRIIDTAGRRLPWATCLYRAIAGRLLLALFGWPSELWIGVRLTRGKLQAHAWLVSEGRILLGQQPEPFRPLLSIGAAGGRVPQAADSMPPSGLRSAAPPPVESLGWLLSRYTLSEGELPLSSLGDPDSLPWPELLRWWVRTGLFPLARHNLLRFGIAVPEPVRRTLDSLFARNALLQDLHESETARLLTLFREEGIPAVAFKGAALARFLYGSPHLRCSTDLDLFLPPEHLAKARTICRQAGYRSPLDPTPSDILVRGHTECGLLRRQQSLSFSLELHWALLWGTRYEKKALARFRDEVLEPGRWSPEWSSLALAASAAKDRWANPKLLLDCRELRLRPGFFRERAWKLARSLGWERLLFHLEEALANPPRLLPPGRRPNRASFAAELPPPHRLGFLLRLLVTPTAADPSSLPLPEGFSLLYSPLHPFFLATRRLFGRSRNPIRPDDPGMAAGPIGGRAAERAG